MDGLAPDYFETDKMEIAAFLKASGQEPASFKRVTGRMRFFFLCSINRSPSRPRISSRIPGTTEYSLCGPWSRVNPLLWKLPHSPPSTGARSTTVTANPARVR